MINAYLRPDGRKGIRNTIVVAYLVECAHHVSREVVFPYREQGVHLIGFPGLQATTAHQQTRPPVHWGHSVGPSVTRAPSPGRAMRRRSSGWPVRRRRDHPRK